MSQQNNNNMWTKPFSIVKKELTSIGSIKLITWFNEQITAGVLHTSPAIFIEFPKDLEPETLNRLFQQMEFMISIYNVTKLITGKDGSVPEAIMQEHELRDQEIYDKFQGFSYQEDGKEIFNSLEREGIKLDMSSPGWAVTRQDFGCEYYQYPVSEQYIPNPKPEASIIPDNSRQEFITVISPNGGETFTQADTVQITWNQFLIQGDVAIELTKLGNPNIIIANNAGYGSFNWIIPLETVPGYGYKIRITSNSNPNIYDESDAGIAINESAQELITITSPNGGETYTTEDRMQITWRRAFHDDGFQISLYHRGYETVIITKQTSGGTFEWFIPIDIIEGVDYKIKITSLSDHRIFDFSDEPFTVSRGK